MSRALLGVDAGTSRIKAVAFSLDGERLAASSAETPVETPRSGWVEQSMDATWTRTARTISAVVDDLGDDHEVVGVGVTGQGDGCWLLDGAGDPVRPAVLWSDGRAGEYVRAWQDDGTSDRLYDVCGSSQFPGSSLVVLRWLRDHEPDALARASTVLFCKDWVKYRLTGELTTDLSDASLPYLDVETGEYAPEVFEIAGVPEAADLLPSLAPGTEVVGAVTPAAADATGLPTGTPVASGYIDVAASAFGSGAVDPGDGSSVVGTTSLSQVVLGEPETGPGRVGYSVALGDGRWTRFMASMTGTPNLDWAIEEIMGVSAFDVVEAEIASVPPASDGVLYHPFLSTAGERAPFLDPNARAQFLGLTQEHTQAHLVRAVYEGISLAMRDCYEHLPRDPDEVSLSGGGASSEFWCQLLADCLDATILVPEGAEFGAKGAALLAGVGVGAYADLPAAVERTTAVAQSFEPRPASVGTYDRWYEVYRRAYEATAEVWDLRAETLADIGSGRDRATAEDDDEGRDGGSRESDA